MEPCYEASVSGQLREAASVILLRRAASGFEVFLLRRRKGASFMANAYVFPGGGAEPGEDARSAAARELFEEAGILLARDRTDAESDTLEPPSRDHMRKRILDGQPPDAVLRLAGLAWATDALVPWSHWITPSIEPKRFSARFFVTELPPGQDPKFDEIETVDQIWLSPADALARSAELHLPPPQIRTCWELSRLRSIDDVLAAGRVRAEEPHPILPRLAQADPGVYLLLPWDPDYVGMGTGESAPLTYHPTWAVGPSRFVLEDKAWKHVNAPGSTATASS
jgi:8-oxo-dGTP pyrophosphatase MutT (NUDIX family)